MPPSGMSAKPRKEILSIEELLRLVKVLLPLGIGKIRITGGEPLLRRGIVGLIAEVKRIDPSIELCMTTNGVLLANQIDTLKGAGLDRVNVSLDTLRPEKFKTLTGFDHLDRVLAGIDMLVSREMFPVKVNVLLLRGFNEDEISNFVEFARMMPVELRFIEKMPIGRQRDTGYLAVSHIEKMLKERFGATDSPRKKGETARLFSMKEFRGRIGLISPISRAFCGDCNRLRITADGKIITCLLEGTDHCIKSAMRRGADDDEIRAIVGKVLSDKPSERSYRFPQEDRYLKKCMANIGG